MANESLFQSVEKPRLSDDVAKQIEQAILEGRFLPGTRLPSERELTVTFGISRPILREALRRLEIQGLISIHHGRGAFVKEPNTDILNVPIANWLRVNHQIVRQFYEARLAIEPTSAALASERATPDQVAALKELVDQSLQITEKGGIAQLIGLDIDLHFAIARMSGNIFLYRMLNSLIVPETDFRKIVLRLPEHLPNTHEGHQQILDAIMSHDPVAARQAMIDALTRPLESIERFIQQQE